MEATNKNALTDPCPFLVVAAGQGLRFGSRLPKQYTPLLGQPLLLHTLTRLHQHPLIPTIIPVIPANGLNMWEELMTPHLHHLPKIAPPVLGGKERQESVRLGLELLKGHHWEWVGIHDGVRPLLTQATLDRLFAARMLGMALIAAIPAQDTIKRVDPNRVIQETLDRNTLWLAQTPQLFHFETLYQAHHQTGPLATDDAALMERMGIPVLVIQGDQRTIKVTQPADFSLVQALLQQEIP
ncbi:MAG: 2-C-methyl-D-erythritol 4-phosphate cytidylyltransferase [Magnetococcus sp. DMHC-6]